LDLAFLEEITGTFFHKIGSGRVVQDLDSDKVTIKIADTGLLGYKG
jgi:hypothetical protein